MNPTKRIAVGLLLLVAVIVALQNTEEVQTRILFASITMPRALLLLVTLTAGFLAGAATGARLARPKKPTEST